MSVKSLPLGNGTMPSIGLGTYLMSSDEAKAATEQALRLGYNHVDTAEVYNNEDGIGHAIAASGVTRESFFLTTKIWPGHEGFGQVVKDYDAVIAQAETAIKLLQVQYVDLYLIHAPFGFTKSLEAGLGQWRAMITLKERGLAKAIGVSNFGLHHLKAIEDAKLPLPDANQIELNPLCQQNDLVAYMKAKNITPIAYSSLAPLSGFRGGSTDSVVAARREAADKVLTDVAGAHNISKAYVLLRWALQSGYAILPKSTREERLISNLAVSDGAVLTEAEMTALGGLNADGDLGIAWGNGFIATSAPLGS